MRAGVVSVENCLALATTAGNLRLQITDLPQTS
jgi:hypothetical protein